LWATVPLVVVARDPSPKSQSYRLAETVDGETDAVNVNVVGYKVLVPDRITG
jgi:hypothetical protein